MVILYALKTFNARHGQGMYALSGPIVGGFAIMLGQRWMKTKEIQMKKNTEMKKLKRAEQGLGGSQGSRIRQGKFPDIALPVLEDIKQKSTASFTEAGDADLTCRLERLDKELSEIREQLIMSRAWREKSESTFISVDNSVREKSENANDTDIIVPTDTTIKKDDVPLTHMQSIFLLVRKLDALTVSDFWDYLKKCGYFLSGLRISDIIERGDSMALFLYSFDYFGYVYGSIMHFLGIESSKTNKILNRNDSFPLDTPLKTSPILLVPISDSELGVASNKKPENHISENTRDKTTNQENNNCNKIVLGDNIDENKNRITTDTKSEYPNEKKTDSEIKILSVPCVADDQPLLSVIASKIKLSKAATKSNPEDTSITIERACDRDGGDAKCASAEEKEEEEGTGEEASVTFDGETIAVT